MDFRSLDDSLRHHAERTDADRYLVAPLESARVRGRGTRRATAGAGLALLADETAILTLKKAERTQNVAAHLSVTVVFFAGAEKHHAENLSAAQRVRDEPDNRRFGLLGFKQQHPCGCATEGRGLLQVLFVVLENQVEQARHHA